MLFCSQPNPTIPNFRIFRNMGMNYKASATHKLKPSPVGLDIPKSEHPRNLSFNKPYKMLPWLWDLWAASRAHLYHQVAPSATGPPSSWLWILWLPATSKQRLLVKWWTEKGHDQRHYCWRCSTQLGTYLLWQRAKEPSHGWLGLPMLRWHSSCSYVSGWRPNQ